MKIMLNSGRISPFFSTRLRLIESIKDRGWDVSVSGYEIEKESLCHEHDTRFYYIPFERAGMNAFRDFRAFREYRKIMRTERFDAVHSYTIKPNIYGSIAAKSVGIKKIFPTINGLGYSFTDNGNKTVKSFIVKMIVSVMYKVAFGCATKVFFQNPDDAELMVQKGLITKDKCVVISGSGINLKEFPYSEPSVSPMRFLIASRLLITKGIRNYCEAAKIVKMKYPEAEFLVAGGLDPNPDGIKAAELDDYISEGVIKYLGHVDDMKRALADCSVFVLPSFYREGVPHAILEAMSIGRAILTCDSPGCRETVLNPGMDGKGENGFLSEIKNSGMLAEKMIWFIEHPEDTKEMGIKSRLYAEKRFDVEKVNKVMIDAMEI